MGDHFSRQHGDNGVTQVQTRGLGSHDPAVELIVDPPLISHDPIPIQHERLGESLGMKLIRHQSLGVFQHHKRDLKLRRMFRNRC